MISISDRQFEAFRGMARGKFRQRLQGHLQAHFSRPLSLIGAGNLDAFLDLALSRAAHRGMTSVATAQSFADHMIMLGAYFDEDPLYAELAEPLFDTDIENPVDRMDDVYELTMDYRDNVEGEGASHLYQALARLNAYLRAPNPGDGTVQEIQETFAKIFPEKSQAQEPHLDAALAAATDFQDANALTTPLARTVHSLVALMAGSGWLEDPMYYGAAPKEHAALRTETDPDRRADLLLSGVQTYLKAVLNAARTDASQTTKGQD